MYKLISNSDSKNNPVFITPWSLIHFLTGVVGIINSNYFNINKNVSLFFLFLIHTLYELKDYYFSYVYNGSKNIISEWASSNSIFNTIGDTLFFVLGMIISININVNKNQLIIVNVFFLLICLIFFTNKNLR